MSAGILWRGGRPALLASTSAPRRRLLEAAGLPVDTETPGIDERAVEASLPPGTDPAALAGRLARDKTLAVAARHPDRVVIGADQVLDLDGASLSKAPGRQESAAQLARLSGRTHRLHSAFAVARAGGIVAEHVATARLTMRPLDAEAIRLYLDAAGDAATRSVGGYEVEALGIHLFSRIEGEHAAILGLPLLPLLSVLRELDLLTF